MTYSRIGGIAFVMVVDGFASMGEEYSVPVARSLLQAFDCEVLFGNRVRMLLFICAIEGVDLLTQHRTLEGAAGLALFFQGPTSWKLGVIEQELLGLLITQTRLAVILA